MVCGTPSSVSVKSFLVSPSMGLPFLSSTVISSITNCVPVVKVATAPVGTRIRARGVLRRLAAALAARFGPPVAARSPR